MPDIARTFCEADWSVAAAWVQAIGSVAAICVAVWLPFNLDKRNRAHAALDKSERSRIVQASLLPSLYKLRSTTSDFIEKQSGKPSFMGVDREFDAFDSDFFGLVPEFKNILAVVPDTGEIQSDVATLSVLLFKANELLSDNSKLQRDGYHAAWINHQDLFLEAANEINALSSRIIDSIETIHAPNKTNNSFKQKGLHASA